MDRETRGGGEIGQGSARRRRAQRPRVRRARGGRDRSGLGEGPSGGDEEDRAGGGERARREVCEGGSDGRRRVGGRRTPGRPRGGRSADASLGVGRRRRGRRRVRDRREVRPQGQGRLRVPCGQPPADRLPRGPGQGLREGRGGGAVPRVLPRARGPADLRAPRVPAAHSVTSVLAAADPVSLSLWVAAWATLLACPFAIAFGWLLARKHFPGKAVVSTLVYAPLVLPPVVTGFVLLKVLGRRGVVGAWLAEHGITLPFTFAGAVIASVVVGFPL